MVEAGSGARVQVDGVGEAQEQHTRREKSRAGAKGDDEDRLRGGRWKWVSLVIAEQS